MELTVEIIGDNNEEMIQRIKDIALASHIDIYGYSVRKIEDNLLQARLRIDGHNVGKLLDNFELNDIGYQNAIYRPNFS